MNRKSIWLLLITGLMGCHSCKQTQLNVQNYDSELVQQEGTWYYHQKLFNGYRVESARDGKILYQLPIVDGKASGEALGWYNTGEKMMCRHFKDGLPEGIFEQWWPNGNYRYRFYYSKGKMNGQQLVFYPTGEKRQESNFLNGIVEGVQRNWDENGDLVSNYTIKNKKLYGIISIRSCIPVDH